MDDIEQINIYFKKLQRTINFDAQFRFAGIAFIKKNKIDDLLCCIIASLPESYKKMMRLPEENKKLKSLIFYNNLFNCIKQKCFFSADLYQVNLNLANTLITSILSTIGKDIAYAEKHT